MNRSYTKGQDLARVLPALDLVDASRGLVEEMLLEIGRLALETVLSMSAAEVAGEPHRGREKGAVLHHGSQCVHRLKTSNESGENEQQIRLKTSKQSV